MSNRKITVAGGRKLYLEIKKDLDRIFNLKKAGYKLSYEYAGHGNHHITIKSDCVTSHFLQSFQDYTNRYRFRFGNFSGNGFILRADGTDVIVKFHYWKPLS